MIREKHFFPSPSCERWKRWAWFTWSLWDLCLPLFRVIRHFGCRLLLLQPIKGQKKKFQAGQEEAGVWVPLISRLLSSVFMVFCPLWPFDKNGGILPSGCASPSARLCYPTGPHLPRGYTPLATTYLGQTSQPPKHQRGAVTSKCIAKNPHS